MNVRTMVPDSTQNNSRMKKRRKNPDNSIKKKMKEYRSEWSFHSELSNSNIDPSPISIRAYIRTPDQMIDHMFEAVRGPSLNGMIPVVLKKVSMYQLRNLCLKELEVMSRKRVKRILDGEGTDEISSSDSDDELETSEEENEKTESQEDSCNAEAAKYFVGLSEEDTIVVDIKPSTSQYIHGDLFRTSFPESELGYRGAGEERPMAHIDYDECPLRPHNPDLEEGEVISSGDEDGNSVEHFNLVSGTDLDIHGPRDAPCGTPKHNILCSGFPARDIGHVAVCKLMDHDCNIPTQLHTTKLQTAAPIDGTDTTLSDTRTTCMHTDVQSTIEDMDIIGLSVMGELGQCDYGVLSTENPEDDDPGSQQDVVNIHVPSNKNSWCHDPQIACVGRRASLHSDVVAPSFKGQRGSVSIFDNTKTEVSFRRKEFEHLASSNSKSGTGVNEATTTCLADYEFDYEICGAMNRLSEEAINRPATPGNIETRSEENLDDSSEWDSSEKIVPRCKVLQSGNLNIGTKTPVAGAKNPRTDFKNSGPIRIICQHPRQKLADDSDDKLADGISGERVQFRDSKKQIFIHNSTHPANRSSKKKRILEDAGAVCPASLSVDEGKSSHASVMSEEMSKMKATKNRNENLERGKNVRNEESSEFEYQLLELEMRARAIKAMLSRHDT